MPSRLSQISDVADALFLAGDALTRAAQEKFKRAPVPRGATLRPGADTPLWLGLTRLVRPLLRAYGAKALLARELGVHRSRITVYFSSRSGMPDAERTLRLLEWLGKACSREPLLRELIRASHYPVRRPRKPVPIGNRGSGPAAD